MIFNGNFMDTWGADEERESKLVFIGKNLDAAELKASFDACLVSAETQAKAIAKLRFAIGAKVKCNTGGGAWSPGEVVKLMYRDEFMPPGMVAPYQVRLRSPCISPLLPTQLHTSQWPSLAFSSLL